MTTSTPVTESNPHQAVATLKHQEKQQTVAQRWLSLAEFVVGSIIVLGHNVFHVVPNEVPILFVLGLLSLRLRGGSWAATGLNRPSSWRRTVLLAFAAAALRILLGAFVIQPLTAHFWAPAVGPAGSDEIQGHVVVAIEWLFLIC